MHVFRSIAQTHRKVSVARMLFCKCVCLCTSVSVCLGLLQCCIFSHLCSAYLFCFPFCLPSFSDCEQNGWWLCKPCNQLELICQCPCPTIWPTQPLCPQVRFPGGKLWFAHLGPNRCDRAQSPLCRIWRWRQSFKIRVYVNQEWPH